MLTQALQYVQQVKESDEEWIACVTGFVERIYERETTRYVCLLVSVFFFKISGSRPSPQQPQTLNAPLHTLTPLPISLKGCGAPSYGALSNASA